MDRQRIAVIGGGVAGLSAAWLLQRDYEVELFEKNDYVGGHTHTIEVPSEAGSVPVDTGFIVYNNENYPHLSALFDHLGVASRPSEMSFSASIDSGALEYAGTNLNTLFAQRRNLLAPVFHSMLRDVLRFNGQAKRMLAEGAVPALTLGEFLIRQGFGNAFRDYYLLPMAAAIWSCPTSTMLAFPLESFLRFFDNHGLMNLLERPQWRTVEGGSHAYVKAMLADFAGRVWTDRTVIRAIRGADGVTVVSRDRTGAMAQQHFDQVVFASHADETLAMLDGPAYWERELLGRFRYQENRAILHSDEQLMPRSRRVWASWNYLANRGTAGAIDGVSVTYWMNQLQGLNAPQQYFVSLNPLREPNDERVIADMLYHHPVFDTGAMRAQPLLRHIQGRNRCWFCGSYFGYGFHEDALRSSVEVAAALGVAAPWLVDRGAKTMPAAGRGIWRQLQAALTT